MGERLAKDVEALFAASVEQRPEWRRMRAMENIDPEDVPRVLVGLFGALMEAIIFLAREVDDFPRRDDP